MKEGPQDGEDGTPRRRLCEQCREPCDSGFTCPSCPVNDGNDRRFHVCGKECQLELWKNHKKEHKRKRDRERQRKIRASRTDEEKQDDNAKMQQHAEAKRASRTNEEVQAGNAAKRQKYASRTEEEVQADQAAEMRRWRARSKKVNSQKRAEGRERRDVRIYHEKKFSNMKSWMGGAGCD